MQDTGTESPFPLSFHDLPQNLICSRQVDSLINQLTGTDYHEDKPKQKASSPKLA